MSGYYDEVEAPYKLRFSYETIETNLHPETRPTRDSILIEIREIEGGSSLRFIDRVVTQSNKQYARKLGDSFRAELSWMEVFDLIEENMQDEKYQAIEVNIPGDLQVIFYSRFKGIFYGSSNGQIFASIYYEEGFFNGDVVFELNEEERKQFKEDKDILLEKYSSIVGEAFFEFKDKRHIYEFEHIADPTSLVVKWRRSNE